MGADPRTDDARWLLDWIGRTNRTQFSRRDAHRAAPRGRFAKATDLEPALRLLEEHGYLRRVDPEPSQDPRGRGRPASPRFLVNPLPRTAEMTETHKNNRRSCFCRFCAFLRRAAGVPNEGRSARRGGVRRGGHGRSCSIWAVTLSNENGPSRSRPCPHPPPAVSGGHKPAMADRRAAATPSGLDHVRGCGWPTHGSSRRDPKAWSRPRSSVGEDDGVGRHPQARQRAALAASPTRSGGCWMTAPKAPRPSPPGMRHATSSQGSAWASPAAPGKGASAAGCRSAGGPSSGGRCGPPTPTAAPPPSPATESRLRLLCAALVRRQADRARSARPTVAVGKPTSPASIGHATLMQCRSLVAADPAVRHGRRRHRQPTRSARSPRPSAAPIPNKSSDQAKRRALTPEEAGRLLAQFPLFWWDHVLCLLGTGLRFGELAGLRRRRVHLDRPMPVLQVGRHPLSGRPVRQRLQAAAQERRRHPPGAPGPAGGRGDPPPAPTRQRPRRPGLHRPWRRPRPARGPGCPEGARTVLSRHNLHRTYQGAVAKLADPAAPSCGPRRRRVLQALRDGGPQPVDQLAARLAATAAARSGRPPSGRPGRAARRRPGRRRPTTGRADRPVGGAAGRPRSPAGGGRPAWRPRLPPHLRDLAGGRRHPGPGHRRADGPRGDQPRRPAAGQRHGRPLPAHHPGDGRPHRRPRSSSASRWCWRSLSRPSRATRTAQRAECSSVTGRVFWQISGKWRSERRVEDALCLVELRGFEPLTPCMPSRDPHHGAHHKASRSRPLQLRKRARVWWFVRLCRAELLRGCCAKWLESVSSGRAPWGRHSNLWPRV